MTSDRTFHKEGPFGDRIARLAIAKAVKHARFACAVIARENWFPARQKLCAILFPPESSFVLTKFIG
jgi:hypothetical protein